MGNQQSERRHNCSDNTSFGREGREFSTSLLQTTMLFKLVGWILINNNLLKVATSGIGTCCLLSLAMTKDILASRRVDRTARKRRNWSNFEAQGDLASWSFILSMPINRRIITAQLQDQHSSTERPALPTFGGWFFFFLLLGTFSGFCLASSCSIRPGRLRPVGKPTGCAQGKAQVNWLGQIKQWTGFRLEMQKPKTHGFFPF